MSNVDSVLPALLPANAAHPSRLFGVRQSPMTTEPITNSNVDGTIEYHVVTRASVPLSQARVISNETTRKPAAPKAQTMPSPERLWYSEPSISARPRNAVTAVSSAGQPSRSTPVMPPPMPVSSGYAKYARIAIETGSSEIAFIRPNIVPANSTPMMQAISRCRCVCQIGGGRIRSHTNMNATTNTPRNDTIVMTSIPEAKTTLIRISTLLNDNAATTPGQSSPNRTLRARVA